MVIGVLIRRIAGLKFSVFTADFPDLVIDNWSWFLSPGYGVLGFESGVLSLGSGVLGLGS